MELDEFLSEEEAAAAIGKSLRTLRQWRRRGIGPPYVLFGRTIRYRKPAFVEHFRQTEIRPVRTRKNGKPEADQAKTWHRIAARDGATA
jgi:Helix-turn-helix domain